MLEILVFAVVIAATVFTLRIRKHIRANKK
jgi:hypothetical protein